MRPGCNNIGGLPLLNSNPTANRSLGELVIICTHTVLFILFYSFSSISFLYYRIAEEINIFSITLKFSNIIQKTDERLIENQTHY